MAGLCLAIVACSTGSTGTVSPPPPPSPALPPPPPPSPTYDVDALGIPRFVADNYLDLAVIEKISRFRSSVGHDYHDQFEGCRSMKHYFFPRSAADWSTIPIYAPVSGAVEFTPERPLRRPGGDPVQRPTGVHVRHLPSQSGYLVVLTDALFAGYVARGVSTRAAGVISRAERDASPLACTGEEFASPDALEAWLALN